MSQASEHARLISAGLAVGDTLPNTLCPVCDGGPYHKRTFSITRYPSRLAYICYRDSCGTRGYVDDEGRTDFRHEHGLRTGGKQSLKPYTGSIRELEQADIDYFWDRFEIPEESSRGLIRIGDHDTYLFPMIDHLGHWVGHVQRQPVWKGSPAPVRSNPGWDGAKALTRMREPGEAMSFHRGRTLPPWGSDHWIIVEDSVSAIKLAAYGYNAVALLSTNINLAKARAMQDAGAKQVTIALDADASQTAFKIAKDYGMAFEKTRVRIMTQDPKDTPADEFGFLFGAE